MARWRATSSAIRCAARERTHITPNRRGHLTPDVAAFLLDLLGRQTLNAAADDLLDVAALCAKARYQLETALTPQ